MPVIPPPQKRRSGGELAGSLDRLPEFWQQPFSHRKDACAILLVLAICAGTAFAGAVHTKIFGHDIFVMLDGGWRVLIGQRPDVDFSPGIGVVVPLVIAAGLKLAHNSVNGVAYASALVGAVVGWLAYAIGRKRMAWFPATLTSLLLTLIVVAPYPLGFSPNTLSHAMLYNRYGYAVLGLVVLEVFQRRKPDQRAWTEFGGVSTGILSAILIFGKPSYGLVALAFAGYSVLLDLRNRWRPIAILLGLTVGCLAIMAWLRFDFAAIWNDTRMQAGAKSSGLNFWEIRWAIVKGLPDILWPALLAVFVVVIRSSKATVLSLLEPPASVILVMIGGALLLATNAQPSGFPLNAVLAIILAEQGRLAAKECGVGVTTGFLRADTVVLLVALLCVAPPFLASAGGLGYAIVQSRKIPPESEVPRFHSRPLAGLLFYDVPNGTESDRRSNGRVYVEYVNNGISLIRSVSRPEDTVYTLDMTNPFPYAMLRPPAHGGAACMTLNHHFNDQYKPSPEWLFGSADIVMVPKHPAAADVDIRALMRNYLPAIQARYRLCAETEWWQLYKPPSHLEGCTVR